MAASRRVFLGLLAGVPLLQGFAPAAAADLYPSNTALYQALTEGVDFGRRHQRHPVLGRTVIIAPHGGGVEPGTSELCLAIAGYHPATFAVSGPVHDYWMFEGLRPSNNDELHVTSTHCDDHWARSLCAGALNAVSLHGCTTAEAGVSGAKVLVGGRSEPLRERLLAELGELAVDASGHESLSGTNPDNIVNRTLLGAGAQLELTTPLRTAMFGVNTRADRKNTTTQVFWDFVAATRRAIAAVESTQPIL